ncbi:hypothetical protein [uncultured Sulfitobacter sp.]|uniref:type III toxin-antitoxin system TenpIN family toxin n=1 Tax=uncultured Sulfitobacter sp. TaxID=191468 RepID=UPI0025968333|nr:hypothetical protein [uncultured Sulfitobacter sp.]
MIKRPPGLFFLPGRLMKLKKLNDNFFNQNKHLVEVLDKDHQGNWDGEKTRGYGVVVISCAGGLTFGIPLRSRIKHKACFRTINDAGLDYSKAVLINDPAHLAGPFIIPSDQYVKIADREAFITDRFEKYVNRYILGVQRGDQNILKHYPYSTLQNYHMELGLPAGT